MLSVAKLRVGQEAYHLSGVAQSLDAYYTGSGEAAGVWVGGGAARLGLIGDVAPDDLRAVLAGIAPGTGGLSPNGDTIRPHVRRVPGFDLTFKAPKSASVLYAVSDDPRVQAAVIDAGEHAMRAAVAWLEEHTIRVRRGTNNTMFLARHDGHPPAAEHVTYGAVAAAFRHRTSRAQDPLLHWHVLIANLACGLDGRWSAIVHPHLYRQAKAAGEVFQAVYRTELTASLGVTWRPGRHVPEIAGIPDHLLDLFSKRSAEIDQWLTATGTPDTPEGRQLAVLATRRNKPEAEHTRFDTDWKQAATAAGWGPDAAHTLITNLTPALTPATVVDDAWVKTLHARLTADATTFTIADLHATIAADRQPGASLAEIERIARHVLAHPDTIPAGDGRWTSREILDLETRFIAALTRTTTPLPPTPLPAGLGPDQAAAVTAITSGTTAVSVLVGPAGTGKTYTVAAIAAAYRAHGIPVIGAAPSARAALELDAVGVPARTLHRHLTRRDDAPAGSLLVIDEAAMADLRTLEPVITAHVATGGRVLLVGDHHQLPEIGAGGAFAYAAAHSPNVAELSVNRRQHEPWEHDALTHLRGGHVPSAVDAYLTHGRVHVADTPTDMIHTAVDAWFTARTNGQRVVLLAGTTATVDALNTAIARHLSEHGETGSDPIRFGSREFRTGERVVIRRNSTEPTPNGTPTSIANGQTGTVTRLRAAGTGVVVRLDTGSDVILTHRYLARGGHLDHAWALTTHRAQGGTWDTAIAVGTDGLYREGAYVQLSRGAHTNQLVITRRELDDLDRQRDTERHDLGLPLPGEDPDTRDDLIARLGRSRAKHLAHHHQPDLHHIDHLARTHTIPQLEARLQAAVAAERHADQVCGFHGPDLLARADHIADIAAHVAIGARVSPTDRHNVGTITALDDRNGAVTVHFTSDDGHHAERTFAWEQLRLIDTTRPRPLPHTAADVIADLHHQSDRWTQAVQDQASEPGDPARLQSAIDHRIERDTERRLADQPVWLTDLVGQPPSDPTGYAAYRHAVRTIAHWQALHPATPDEPLRRPVPGDDSWDRLRAFVGDARESLASTARLTPPLLTARTPDQRATRLVELDAILAAAPPTWRPLTDMIVDGQLPLEAMQAAGDAETDTARNDWILEHWPHVVEHHQITSPSADRAVWDTKDLLDLSPDL